MKYTKIKFEDLIFLNETRNIYAEEFLHDSRLFSIEETQKWFISVKPDYWIIWNDEERIGYFRLSNYSVENKNIYIGADIHPNYTGKGFAYTAYTEFIKTLFDSSGVYDLNKISLEVLSTNQRAINLYRKLGFIQEGCKREEVLKNKTYIDSIFMSMLKKEFLEKNTI